MKFRAFVVSLLVILVAATSFAGVSKKELQSVPPEYRQWLQRDVAYIITNEEKEAFLRLTSNADRDKFIQQFWEVRNPTPGSPTNAYKDEIYRRIAYADQWFGHNSNMEGWRTDRGRVYITLGKPKQVARYYGFADIRPMEIWFYDNDNPALPPFFYVLFYQRETGGEFRIYSPYVDGPEKLVTGSTEGDRLASWKQIDHDAGREVSRITLSLLPNEPIDYDTATSSLQSDVMLNTIRGLANNPINKELLDTKRRLLEAVSHRVVMQGDYLDVLTVPLVDAAGETNVHYVLRLRRPEDFTLQEDQNHRWFYSASVSAKVMTPEGKLIFSQQRKLTHFVDEGELTRMKHRVFGFEGVLPLPPGKYKVHFELSNELAKTTFPADREVVVPDRPTEGMRITEVVPFSAAEGGAAAYLPFSVAGVRFTPTFDRGLTLVPGQDLTFFYQLWQSPEDQAKTGNLEVEYSYGRMGMQDTKSIKEELARDQFDKNGAMVNGKKIPTAELLPGNYRMSIIVTDPTTHKRSVGSFQFAISDAGASTAAWDITDPEAAEDLTKGTRDLERALCYGFAGNQKMAAVSLQLAFAKNPSNEEIRDRLVNSLYTQDAFKDIAAVYSKTGVTKDTDEQTILQIADSLGRVGQMNRSIQLLESALTLKQSGPLYLALARCYQTVGDVQKASEMESKGKALATGTPKT